MARKTQKGAEEVRNEFPLRRVLKLEESRRRLNELVVVANCSTRAVSRRQHGIRK